MRVLEAKDFLVQQTAEQAALEKRAPFRPRKTNDVFHRDRRMPGRSHRTKSRLRSRIRHGSVRKEDFSADGSSLSEDKARGRRKATFVERGVSRLSQGDHYILLFWRQNPFAKSPRNWPTYILGALAVAVLILFLHFFFGGKSSFATRSASTCGPVLTNSEPAGSAHSAISFPTRTTFRDFPSASLQAHRFVPGSLSINLSAS